MTTKVKPKPVFSKRGGTKTAPDAPALVLELDGKVRRVPPDSLKGDKEFDTLLADCKAAKAVAARLTEIPAFAPAGRFAALDFLAALGSATYPSADGTHPSALDAVLAADPGPDLRRQENWRAAALESAALFFGDALLPACNRIRDAMVKRGLAGVRVATLMKDAQALLAAATKPSADAAIRVIDVLPNAPVPMEALVPQGWTLSPSGSARVGSTDPGWSVPVLISELGRDQTRGTETVTLVSPTKGGWKELHVERREIADAAALVKLSSAGVRVNSNNARDMVQFLADFEAVNAAALPTVSLSSKLGWQPGMETFLWGSTAITVGDAAGTVRFRGTDQGDHQLVAGFTAKGNLAGWLKLVQKAAPCPRVMLGIYASFVPPMIELLNTFNFVVDYAGPTTGGKTTTLRAVASVWGNPDERSPGTLLQTWNSTLTYRERASAVFDGLPLVLDDTKNVRFPEEVAKTIYGVTQGRGRGRGSQTGIAAQGFWRTVLFSSGEQPAVSFTKNDDGVRSRVLTSWGAPLGGNTTEAGNRAKEITQIATRHHGVAGPEFVRFVLQNRTHWKEWRKQYAGYVTQYEQRAGNDTVAGRMAAHFGAIVFTSKLVHEALGFPGEWADPVDPLWQELTGESGEADRPTAALKYVVSWAVANRDKFAQKCGGGQVPPGGWFGRWDEDAATAFPGQKKFSWPWLGVMPHVLDEVLRKGGFEPESTVRAWKDRDWLKTNPEDKGEKRRTWKAQVGKEMNRVVAVKRSAVDQVRS